MTKQTISEKKKADTAPDGPRGKLVYLHMLEIQKNNMMFKKNISAIPIMAMTSTRSSAQQMQCFLLYTRTSVPSSDDIQYLLDARMRGHDQILSASKDTTANTRKPGSKCSILDYNAQLWFLV